MGKENTYKPQKLWFIDKNIGEKAVVSAEKIENGKITFSYQGKQYTIPVSMLGKKVYACLPEKPQAKLQEKPRAEKRRQKAEKRPSDTRSSTDKYSVVLTQANTTAHKKL